MRASRFLSLVALASTLVAGASFPGRADSPKPSHQMSELGWMAGDWAADVDGLRMEEVWLEPRGGLMLGLHRDVRPTGEVMFEYLRIEATAKGIAYVASPRGRAETPFPLVRLEGSRAVFENLDHDFPQRIIYWLEDDVLHARVEGPEDGRTRSIEWQWTRVP